MLKKSLIGLTKEEIFEELKTLNVEKYRVKQIWNWIYYFGVKDFSQMNNLSQKLRDQLNNLYTLDRPKINKKQISKDGTIKWLLEFEDKETIELVYIPADDRGTICISSQVGCAMSCRFCNTGFYGFNRNLTSKEIVSEILVARDELNEWDNLNKSIGDGRLISNIVVMGMGEPLNNYNNVVKALKIINDPDGIAFSNRRITLSTCGIVPKIKDLSNDLKINLAISLHASNDETRKQIMPIAEKYSIDEIMKSCYEYAIKTNNRRITFEYILIKDLNDKKEDAKKLLSLVKKYHIPAKFNLIPFNYWNGCPFKEPPSIETINNFAKILTSAGYPAPIRISRGSDISAACGQLKNQK